MPFHRRCAGCWYWQADKLGNVMSADSSHGWLITGSHGSGNTVVSPMGLVYGKPITSDPCISETAEGNLTKIGRGDYVVTKFMCANFQKNRAAGFSPAHTQHVHPPMAFFFGFINQATAQTAEPIFTHNTSKEPVWAKEVPFGGQKFWEKFFDPKRGQKPPFPCISMGNENADNF